ncbi:MAG: NifB/NifX family molybdenum-iron cluster-binding protein [Gemmatimonadota bacterium]
MPTVNEKGLEARLSPHFGSAPFFTVVDTETGEAAVIANGHAQHEHGHCMPARALEGQGIGAIVCRGLGRRALMKLKGQGMDVLVTEAWTVADALEAYRGGQAVPMTEQQACAGHGHGEGHGHGHGHSHSHGPVRLH